MNYLNFQITPQTKILLILYVGLTIFENVKPAERFELPTLCSLVNIHFFNYKANALPLSYAGLK